MSPRLCRSRSRASCAPTGRLLLLPSLLLRWQTGKRALTTPSSRSGTFTSPAFGGGSSMQRLGRNRNYPRSLFMVVG